MARAASRTSAHRNRVRIIGGAWRSRVLGFPDTDGLRPTPDRVRETLFNWLGQDITGLHCLDLYAGSGALGFEALSRGAATVTMVERDGRTWRAILENGAMLGAHGLNLVRDDALEFLAQYRGKQKFDVVFLDPPFAAGVPEAAWPRLLEVLSDGGLIYLESNAPYLENERLHVLKRGQAGAVYYHLLGRKRNEKGRISGDI